MTGEPEQLLDFIVQHYNLEELRTLCFKLPAPYDELPGETLSAKARELILYLLRGERLADLLAALQKDHEASFSQATFSKDPAVLSKALSAAGPAPAADLPPPLTGRHFERKIAELQLAPLVALHDRYDPDLGQTIPLSELFVAFRPLFNRKTFDEPFPECVDENWHDRLSAVVQIEHILDSYLSLVMAAAAYEGDPQGLLAYEAMQKELRRYSQDMTGLFRPPPVIADLEDQFLAGDLEQMRSSLRAKDIHPREKIPASVFQACERHRQNILEQLKSWPAVPD